MTNQTKLQKLIKRLKRGWTSPIDALQDCGLFSLSQRCGELRRSGVNVVSKWKTSATGSRFKVYRIATGSRLPGKGC